MPLITQHHFLEEMPLQSDSQALILGTIYPYASQGTQSFLCQFFYGNKYSLWGLLKKAFPHLPIDAKEEIVCPHQAAEKIKNMLRLYHIAISDTVKVAVRPDYKPSADHFLAGTQYHNELIQQIRQASALKTIFFTGKKVVDIFRSLYVQAMRKEGLYRSLLFPQSIGSGEIFTLQDTQYLRKELRCILLPSPSPSARRGKSRAFVASGWDNYQNWRLRFYRDAFERIFVDL